MICPAMSVHDPDSTAWDDELLRNPHAAADKRSRVQKMFAAIAPSYDINNRLHSLWMDQHWRAMAVDLAALKATDRVVDVACGTGDLTLKFVFGLWWERTGAETIGTGLKYPTGRKFAEPGQVIGVDFTFEMLKAAKDKNLPWKGGIDFVRCAREATECNTIYVNGDAQSLPLPDESTDVVSIAFGIRNVQSVPTALKEFHRILRPGGRVIILEFSLPTNPILRGLYNFYFRQILPRTATLISGDKTGAYKYLPESVNTFIGREQMIQMMQDAGFVDVKQFPMTFGVCVCYRGLKK
jgi:demethylmenaquinone methyltransferase/2-methoxy-6-polyprenyl-1,4-benzoquinol methylase